MRRARRNKVMGNLIREHKDIPFKAGDWIEFTGEDGLRVEGIVVAIDEQYIDRHENELLVMSREPIFDDNTVFDRGQWDETDYSEGLELLDAYDDEWYWDWVYVEDATPSIKPFTINELVVSLQSEVK